MFEEENEFEENEVAGDFENNEPGDSTDSFADDEGQSGNNASEQSGLPEKFTETLLGKGVDDLHKMLYEQTQHISKLQNKNVVVDEGKRIQQSRSKTEKNISNIDGKLSDLDPILDSAAYEKLSSQKIKQEVKLKQLDQSERTYEVEKAVKSSLDKNFNDEFVVKSKAEILKRTGLDLSQIEMDNIVAHAHKSSDSGKLTATDIEIGLMKHVGAENYKKAISAQAEQKFRDDLGNAGRMDMGALGNKVSFSNKKSWSDKSANEKARAIGKMSNKEFRKQYYSDHGVYPEADM